MAGFKQQCPSCEHMVPIKDESLVGKKTDCPKCKFRFAVEEPADSAPPAKDGGKAKDKGKPGKAKGKSANPDAGDKAKKKKKAAGGSNMLLIGGIVGGLAILGLAVTAVVIWM